MALINCPECGENVSDKAEKCPKCSFPMQTTSKNTEGFFLQSLNFGCMFVIYFIIAVVIIFILFTIFD
jgi:predicted amidophosphoribosyltransferase